MPSLNGLWLVAGVIFEAAFQINVYQIRNFSETESFYFVGHVDSGPQWCRGSGHPA